MPVRADSGQQLYSRSASENGKRLDPGRRVRARVQAWAGAGRDGRGAGFESGRGGRELAAVAVLEAKGKMKHSGHRGSQVDLCDARRDPVREFEDRFRVRGVFSLEDDRLTAVAGLAHLGIEGDVSQEG